MRLARTRTINYPLDGKISTPLLVPSFSSKGFTSSKNGKSEITQVFKATEPYLVGSILVSAFDVCHAFIPPLNKCAKLTDLVFIDSGGYEKGSDHDESTFFTYPTSGKKWNEQLHGKVLRKLRKGIPAVVVNFDYKSSMVSQIKNAKTFFNKFPNLISDFLIKPETRKTPYINIENILKHVSAYSEFDIIGLTEKELGNSTLEKMINIAKLRIEMDKRSVAAPIHIFGSLDPLSSWLYFLAGAEIFDGLTWLRFFYQDGVSLYKQNFVLANGNLAEKEEQKAIMVFAKNLVSLRTLQLEMKNFAADGDFSKISHHSEFLENQYKLMISHLEGSN